MDLARQSVGRKQPLCRTHRCREGHGWPGAASYINRECLGLIGPNGAGKSTPLKMLNGLHS
jgi:hypothetical protein